MKPKGEFSYICFKCCFEIIGEHNLAALVQMGSLHDETCFTPGEDDDA